MFAVPLDPQVEAYLTQIREADAPDPAQTPLAQARRLYDQAAVELFGAPEQVAYVEDVVAEGVPLRIYRPSAEVLPGLVYLHGGGWVLGGHDSHDPLCRTLSARTGCAVIAVDYRLAPEHPYPAAVDDAWTATLWAAEWFSPLGVAGDSAGGQLAAAVALRARDAAISLTLQVLVYPATDYGFELPPEDGRLPEAVLGSSSMRWYWSQYVQDEKRSGEPDCSPLRAAELTGIAPAVVMTAEFDPLREQGEAYARRLEQAGVPVVLWRYEGQIHGFLRMPAVIDRADEAIDDVAREVRSALKPSA